MKGNCKISPDFEVIMKSFLKTVALTVRPGTVRCYYTSIKYFMDYLATRHPDVIRLADLKRSPHIEGWLISLVSRGLGKGTRRIHITCIHRFLNLMYEWEWKDVPEPGLLSSRDMPRLDEHLPKSLTPEMDVKLEVYLRSKPKLMAQALLLLRKTGLRIGELRDLKLNCLEKLPDGHYVLHVPIGKLRDERTIPVDGETVEIISRIKKLRGNYLPLQNPRTGKAAQFLLMFGRHWRRPSYAGLRKALKNLAIASGIEEHVHPHRLRHTYASELIRGGISLPALMKLLGHKDITMTLRYVKVFQTDIHEAYHNAIEKNKSVHALLQSIRDPAKSTDNPTNVLEGINNTIAMLRSAHKDSNEKASKKKLQRMLERLRRISRDIDSTLKD